MGSYHKLRHHFYYKVRWIYYKSEIVTVITRCHKYYKLQQNPKRQTEPADIQCNFKFSLDLFLSLNGKINFANKTKKAALSLTIIDTPI